MAANAAGFVLEDAPAAERASVIRRAHAGERVIDSALAVSACGKGTTH